MYTHHTGTTQFSTLLSKKGNKLNLLLEKDKAVETKPPFVEGFSFMIYIGRRYHQMCNMYANYFRPEILQMYWDWNSQSSQQGFDQAV